jgi:hypothetical protein
MTRQRTRARIAWSALIVGLGAIVWQLTSAAISGALAGAVTPAQAAHAAQTSSTATNIVPLFVVGGLLLALGGAAIFIGVRVRR